MTSIDVGEGIQVEVNESGRGDGRAVLLLHGLTGNSSVWAAAGPGLAPRFRVLSIDQRGHGAASRTDDPSDFTLEKLAADVFKIADHYGYDTMTLVGHGMGGTVALLAALAEPDRIDALVLVGTSAAPLDPGSGWMRTRAAVVKAVEKGGIEAGWETYLESGIFGWETDEMPSEIVEAWKLEFCKTTPAAFVGLARDLAAHRDLSAELKQIEAPALVVAGDDDSAYADHIVPLAEALALGQLQWIEGGGHTPHLSRSEEFNEAVFAFLKRSLPAGTK